MIENSDGRHFENQGCYSLRDLDENHLQKPEVFSSLEGCMAYCRGGQSAFVAMQVSQVGDQFYACANLETQLYQIKCI